MTFHRLASLVAILCLVAWAWIARPGFHHPVDLLLVAAVALLVSIHLTSRGGRPVNPDHGVEFTRAGSPPPRQFGSPDPDPFRKPGDIVNGRYIVVDRPPDEPS